MRLRVKKLKTYLDKIKKENKQELEQIESIDKGLDLKGIKFFQNEQKFSTGTMFKFWIIGALVVYLCFLAFNALDFIYLILASYIISIAVESIILFFQKKLKFPRGAAILTGYVVIFSFFIGGLVLIIPFIINQFSQVLDMLLGQIQYFQKILSEKGLAEMIASMQYIPFKSIISQYLSHPEVVDSLQSALEQNISNIVSFGSSLTKDFGGILVNFFSIMVKSIYNVVLTFVLAIFFSLEKDDVIKVLAAFSGQPDIFIPKIQKLYLKLGYWLKGQVFLSFIIGIMVFVLLRSLEIFGISLEYKGTLALIAGITEFVPYLGPVLGAFPALLIAFPKYGLFGIAVVGLTYYLVQAAENNIIVPRVMNLALGVSSLLIFIAMLIGASMLGFMGIVLAVPLAVIVSIGFEDFIIKRK